MICNKICNNLCEYSGKRVLGGSGVVGCNMPFVFLHDFVTSHFDDVTLEDADGFENSA